MIPTTTSAAGLTDLVLPDLAGRVTSHSVRVPSASVSAVDLVVRLEKHADVATLNNAIDMQSDNIIGTTVDPLVSSDLRGRPESLILALPETSVNDGLTRVFGWYDNEWGFSNRMLDVVERL
jgi:glyceraldehyde 3-phosphate dehydrogenase